MLHTLQCQFSVQCSPTYINFCYVNDTTRPTSAKLSYPATS